MKMTVNMMDDGTFYNVSTGVEYTKENLQRLKDCGMEIVFLFDYLDYV